ncbi:8-oxo-dGTP diphosphatase [Bacillus thermophilus]|uniref:8-oxo-dGTP diphosphatase n=1 Tax=Siminovitchia thermophila TaxID=1245522 RepID=A0ABS2R8A8_9BACI|nr:nucleoside triphosphatase YtkD [Siminovitchia thermophila]MBM7715877.1 8-oxo-dGTP diphosphatase [Siminovitchia thermophila]ONK23972.1 nucleoside triphosphatase YtkD [Bacillus sp. VT-16-64]
MSIQFFDQKGKRVTLAFQKNAFQQSSGHVLAICRYRDEWLLTNHPARGLEFPGGKLEKGESVEDAAIREIYEETGAVANIQAYVGEYLVEEKTGASFVKAIVLANILKLEKKNHYHETKGPVFVQGDLLAKVHGEEFSFIMKDRVVEEALKRCCPESQ